MSPVLLDSSCWIEIFTEGSLAKECGKPLKSGREIIVPTLVIFEVYRKIASSLSDDHAMSAVAFLSQYKVSELSREIAMNGADISILRKLPMADSLILAHAENAGATLITLDNDFHEIPNVQIIRH